MTRVYDILGIGFGPANIALAVALEERRFEGDLLFLEQHASPQWQPEMLLPGSDIQNHPCRDLVTPHNPRSRYTFLNYLHEHGRLFDHLNLGIPFPLRTEYAQYVAWVASFFGDRVRSNARAEKIERINVGGRAAYAVTDSAGNEYRCRCLVVAPGRTPYIPAAFASLSDRRITHLNGYLSTISQLEKERPPKRVCVVGGSQSAVEIVLHLNERYDDAVIHNVMRGYGYRLKDLSPFSTRVYFPEFIDYYYNCTPEARARLNQQLHYTNYSAADGDVINKLYVTMYEQRLSGRQRVQVHNCEQILACRAQEKVSLTLHEVNTGSSSELEDLDLVVLATGFKDLGTAENQEPYPAILREIVDDLRFNPRGVLHINRDYSLSPSRLGDDLPPIFLNGLCESTHGYGDAGSFSLLAMRAQEITDSALSRISMQEKVFSHG